MVKTHISFKELILHSEKHQMTLVKVPDMYIVTQTGVSYWIEGWLKDDFHAVMPLS